MRMDEGPNQAPNNDSDPVDSDRREFLRTSVYAAYATPLITALLVEEASAANSGTGCDNKPIDFCEKNPWHRCCQ
jgi:hypothetical protein